MEDGPTSEHLSPLRLTLEGECASPPSESPPRVRASMDGLSGHHTCLGQTEKPQVLRNVSAVSRSLATPQIDLVDQSSVMRSLAVLSAMTSTTIQDAHQHGASVGQSQSNHHQLVQRMKPFQHSALTNMSAVSHNLANVGALPQCNQRHARCTAPVAIVEPEMLAVVRTIDHDARPVSTTASSTASSLLSAAKHTPRRKRISSGKVPLNKEEALKKLEVRRTKNREAAERMRRRRREETDVLQKTVQDLAAQVASVTAKLAAAEEENQQLRNLFKHEHCCQRRREACSRQHIPVRPAAVEPITRNTDDANQLFDGTCIVPVINGGCKGGCR
mmetsp:Transcript_31408/g.100919  ORF Transcript_31408/g.100919 Transcript_31408/m.100919 type:complete len:331 (-) Transcript_31408:177-1169(-)